MAHHSVTPSFSDSIRREFQAKSLAYILTVIVTTACLQAGHASYELMMAIASLALYPPFLLLYLKKIRTSRPASARFVTITLDSMIAGAVLVALGLPPVESILCTALILYTGITRFGFKSLIYIPTLMCLSGLLLFQLNRFYSLDLPQLFQPMPVEITLISALAAMIYLCYLASVARSRQRSYVELRASTQQQQQHYSQLANDLAKYLSPQVWTSIFAGRKSAKLESQRKKLTVFFSDIKGFTELSEELEAEELTDMLNQYLTEMSSIALKYGGTIDKFMGDSIVIFFGDPQTRGPKKDALAAVSMAIAMRRHMKVLRQQWRAQGIERPLEIRMGLNTGYCTVGNFGAENRMDYTLIGREVNLASRLESLADANEILISHETWSLIKEHILCQNKGEMRIKGFSRTIPTYTVLDFRHNLGEKPSYMDFEAQGFSLFIDGDSIVDQDKRKIIKQLKEATEKLEKNVNGKPEPAVHSIF